MSKYATDAVAVLVAVWLVIARPGATGDQGRPAVPTKAICVMQPLADAKVSGLVTFTQVGDEVEVKGEISGLTPGLHGFHVHEFGDITSKDGMSTGGHFN